MFFNQSPKSLGNIKLWAAATVIAPVYLGAVGFTAAIGLVAVGASPFSQGEIQRLSAADFDEIGGGARSYETRGLMVQTMDDFWSSGADMGSDRHWQKRRSSTSKKAQPVRLQQSDPFTFFQGKQVVIERDRSNLGGRDIIQRAENDLTGMTGGAKRHVCVRLCDGYYWPVSYDSNDVTGDSAKCKSSCKAPARLFIDSDPGTGLDEMHDTKGRPYSQLKNAYRYRNEYVSACTCKAQPWEAASLKRHQHYALLAAAKTDRSLRTLAKAQRRKVAKLKRQYRRQKSRAWRQIAKVEASFWAPPGAQPRYSLGAKEVIVTDDDQILNPIEVISETRKRPTKRKRRSRRDRVSQSAIRSNSRGALAPGDRLRSSTRQQNYSSQRMGLTRTNRPAPRAQRRAVRRSTNTWNNVFRTEN